MKNSHLFSIQKGYLVENSLDRSERGKTILRFPFIPTAFVAPNPLGAV